jgi:DNA-binding beta-propeller fold protein YncE
MQAMRRSRVVRAVAIGAASLLCLAFAPSALGADRVYWANTGNDTISFANLDGSGGGGQLSTAGATPSLPYGLAIDPAAGRIYWANTGNNTISFAHLDGSGGGGQLSTAGATVSAPRGVAIDPAVGRIYWANTGNNTISFANLDGSGGGGQLSTAGATVSFPQGVAIDPAAGRIYWANSANNTISFANLDGSGGGGQLSTAGATVSAPVGVAIDPAAGRIYWANQNNDTISFANLDGTGGGQLSTAGATVSTPNFPALLRTPAGTGAPSVSGGGEVGQELSCSQGSWAADLLGSFLYRAPRSFARQWRVDGADIAGATQPTYTPTAPGDYSCRVTATNQAGSTSQTSAPRTVSATPTPPTPDPTPPSLEITVVKLNEQKGIAKLTVEFDPSGSLRVDETNKVRGTEPVEVEGPGTAELTIAARGKGLKRLARRGEVTVNPRAFFESPNGAIGKRHKFKLRADVTPGEICLKCWRP